MCMYGYLDIINSTTFSFHKILQKLDNHKKYLLKFIFITLFYRDFIPESNDIQYSYLSTAQCIYKFSVLIVKNENTVKKYISEQLQTQ
jgi:hypothetical protein